MLVVAERKVEDMPDACWARPDKCRVQPMAAWEAMNPLSGRNAQAAQLADRTFAVAFGAGGGWGCLAVPARASVLRLSCVCLVRSCLPASLALPAFSLRLSLVYR
jgi:hypothetical protein